MGYSMNNYTRLKGSTTKPEVQYNCLWIPTLVKTVPIIHLYLTTITCVDVNKSVTCCQQCNKCVINVGY